METNIMRDESVKCNMRLLAALITFAAAVFTMMLLAGVAKADQITCRVDSSDGYPTDVLTDDNYMTTDYYMEGTALTISADQKMDGLYIKWDSEPGPYKLTVNGTEYEYGTHDYLHEYIKLPSAADEVTLTIPKDRVNIADIYAFSAGELPEWVEVWDATYDKADILIFSAHSDDEILFMGSIIPTYIDRGCRVQVAYYCDLSLTEPYRRHEQLAGLWTMGVKHYPQMGEFADTYSEDLETARVNEPDLDASLEYVVRTIRRFKPQVLVSHDLEGEYGHGQHRLLADLVMQAVEITADAGQYQESVNKYGTWDVPKTYLHIYGDNQITIDDTVPLASFGGRTSFEICKAAYARHESQSWMWFFVGDEYSIYENPESSKYGQQYEYPFNRFGLYRSLVGADTGNDIMEHLTSYDEQQRIEEEAAAKARAEEESRAAVEAQLRAEQEAKAAAEAAARRTIIWIIVIVVIVVILLVAGALMIREKKRRERARRRAAARRAAARRSGR